MLSTRDPFAVVVEMVTAVSLAPEHLEDRVDAIVDILMPEVAASVGLLIRADVMHLDVQLLGSQLPAGVQRGMGPQISAQLADPLLAPIAGGDLSPTSASRAYGTAQWGRSTARAGCMITFGVDQIATLPVHAGSDLVTFLVGRAGADFTDGDLALLKVVQPVVAGLGVLLRLPRHTPALEPEDPEDPTLTGREVEMLELLAQGHKAVVIGRKAGCSTRTVHRHLGNIYDKLGVSDRLSAVNRGYLLGVLSGGDFS